MIRGSCSPQGDLVEARRKMVTRQRALTLVQKALNPGNAAGQESVTLRTREAWVDETVVGHSALTGHVGCFSFVITMNKQLIFSEFSRPTKSLLIVWQNFWTLN